MLDMIEPRTAALIACIVFGVFVVLSYVFSIALGTIQRVIVSTVIGIGLFYLWQTYAA